MNFSTLNEILVAIIVGIAQGLTEFVPVSSTAHMRIVTGLITGGRDIGQASGNFIQLGTLLAVFLYFWNDIQRYVQRIVQYLTHPKDFVEASKQIRAWLFGEYPYKNPSTDIEIVQLVIGTIPIIIIGFLFKDTAANSRDFITIAGFLLFGSGLMFFADYVSRIFSNNPNMKNRAFGLGETILIGLFQSLAIFPGVSRSGATVSGTLLLGHERERSIRFAFLLSLPSLFLAGLLSMYEIFQEFRATQFALFPSASLWTETDINLSITSLFVAFALAFISGYVSLKWLLQYLAKNTFTLFIVYRLVLAAAIIGYSVFSNL